MLKYGQLLLFALLLFLIPAALVQAQTYSPPKTNIDGDLNDWGNGRMTYKENV